MAIEEIIHVKFWLHDFFNGPCYSLNCIKCKWGLVCLVIKLYFRSIESFEFQNYLINPLSNYIKNFHLFLQLTNEKKFSHKILLLVL